MPDTKRITVEATVRAPLGTVWECWTGPEHIQRWNSASDDWHTPRATVDLRKGGKFLSRMEAKDGSAGFDFEGTFTNVEPQKTIEYAMSDGRTVSVTFEDQGGGIRIVETFDAEGENPVELQRQGWQAILDNFKRYVESRPA